jgi:hypothetical protein
MLDTKKTTPQLKEFTFTFNDIDIFEDVLSEIIGEIYYMAEYTVELKKEGLYITVAYVSDTKLSRFEETTIIFSKNKVGTPDHFEDPELFEAIAKEIKRWFGKYRIANNLSIIFKFITPYGIDNTYRYKK